MLDRTRCELTKVSDRALAERVRETGAEVVGPRWLLDRFVE